MHEFTMLLQTILVILFEITSFVQANPFPIPRVSLSRPNSTLTTLHSTSTSRKLDSAPSSASPSFSAKSFPPSPNSSGVCCFLVQDTISEEWWQELGTSTTVGVVTVTTITTFLSKGSDGVGTIITSNSSVEVVKTTFVFDWNIGVNPLATLYNPAPGPTEVSHSLIGTATVTGGVLVESPAAFYVYNSVKIITADAVTDDDGNVMCATASSYEPLTSFPNINSNAEAYYAGPSIEGQDWSASSVIVTITSTLTFIEPTVFTTTPTMTELEMSYTTYYVNSGGTTVTPSPDQPGSVISLTEPFIWQAPWGATGATSVSAEHCLIRGTYVEQYGYIPQTLLDYLIQNPYYSAQYPGLASCVPGGPSVIFGICLNGQTPKPPMSPLPSTVALPAGGGLTSEETQYIPDVTIPPAPGLGGLGTSPPVTTPWPNPSPNPTPYPSPAPNPPPPSRNGLQTSIPNPAPPALFSTSYDSGTPILIITPTTIPLSLAPSGLAGITTTISGTPYLIIPTPTSLALTDPSADPLNQNSIAITTTINGIPYILVPSGSRSRHHDNGIWRTGVRDGGSDHGSNC